MSDTNSGVVSAAVIYFILVATVIIGVPGWYVWADGRVSQACEAGILTDARFMDSFATRTEVHTTRGIFLVVGGFRAYRGHVITLQKRLSGSDFLCDLSMGVCSKLVE